MGRGELHAVQSLLIQALPHELKAMAWPLSSEAPHWQAEARGFWRQARRQLTPSMRQRIDLADLHADALDRLPSMTGGVGPMPVPATCWASHDDLLKSP